MFRTEEIKKIIHLNFFSDFAKIIFTESEVAFGTAPIYNLLLPKSYTLYKIMKLT